MADCDICGRPATTKAIVEGATLSVCGRCVSYGRELSAPTIRRPNQPRPMVELEVVEGYGSTVRHARERSGLTRQELARKLFILENVLERIENEHLKPNEAVAKKLEKELGITLLGPRNGDEGKPQTKPFSNAGQSSGRGLTLADLVEIKKK
ncbi:MAG: multiprotein-bridging factor 1 family protein [Candidatus Micrarchaeia archaeon]